MPKPHLLNCMYHCHPAHLLIFILGCFEMFIQRNRDPWWRNCEDVEYKMAIQIVEQDMLDLMVKDKPVDSLLANYIWTFKVNPIKTLDIFMNLPLLQMIRVAYLFLSRGFTTWIWWLWRVRHWEQVEPSCSDSPDSSWWLLGIWASLTCTWTQKTMHNPCSFKLCIHTQIH
jgi:hypothetical protein